MFKPTSVLSPLAVIEGLTPVSAFAIVISFTGVASGANTMFTVKRLVAAASNKIWYEDI